MPSPRMVQIMQQKRKEKGKRKKKKKKKRENRNYITKLPAERGPYGVFNARLDADSLKDRGRERIRRRCFGCGRFSLVSLFCCFVFSLV